MNKRLFSVALSIGVFMTLAVASASAQKVGGYKDVDVDAAVESAAEFAVDTQAKKTGKEMSLASVVRAEMQVVAGRNYRLCLQVDSEGGEGQDAVTIYVQTVVYVDLKGNKKLSSWLIADCSEE